MVPTHRKDQLSSMDANMTNPQVRRVMSASVISAIALYQKYLSPYKGFSCAHRVLCSGVSCSSFAKAALANNALPLAIRLIRARFAECAQVASQARALRRQAAMGLAGAGGSAGVLLNQADSRGEGNEGGDGGLSQRDKACLLDCGLESAFGACSLCAAS